jgi:hypothetical protein
MPFAHDGLDCKFASQVNLIANVPRVLGLLYMRGPPRQICRLSGDRV